ncbi:MAG TPA: hypothetical protein VJH91_01145, partial [Candidatus Paceibacterota bacterium]
MDPILMRAPEQAPVPVQVQASGLVQETERVRVPEQEVTPQPEAEVFAVSLSNLSPPASESVLALAWAQGKARAMGSEMIPAKVRVLESARVQAPER